MATEIVDYLEVLYETDKAVLFRCKRGEVWIPHKVIVFHDDECVEILDTFDLDYKPHIPSLSDGFGEV